MNTQLVKQISKNSGSNFYYTFLFLDKEQRDAIHTVYSFCRLSDDIVDSADLISEKKENLSKWKNSLEECIKGQSTDYLFKKLKRVIDSYSIPTEYFYDIILGMEMDLTKNSYANFSELELYCYRVAGVVGLISIKIFGCDDETTKEYAISLATALQLTNIIRDVYTDSKNDRIYLPEEDFIFCNYLQIDLIDSLYNDSFYQLMQFEYDRALSYFRKSQTLFKQISDKRLRVAQMMGAIYYRLLEEIRIKKFNVFTGEIVLSKRQKMLSIILQFTNSTFL